MARRQKSDIQKVIELLKTADLRIRIEIPSKNEAILDALEEVGRAISALYDISSKLNVELTKL